MAASTLVRSWPAVIIQTGTGWTMSVQTNFLGGVAQGTISGNTFTIVGLSVADSDVYQFQGGQGQGVVTGSSISGPLQGTLSGPSPLNAFTICNALDHRFTLTKR